MVLLICSCAGAMKKNFRIVSAFCALIAVAVIFKTPDSFCGPFQEDRKPVAQPPLQYQIQHAEKIVIVKTVVQHGHVSYELASVLKGEFPEKLVPHLNLKTFELLGYKPAAHQEVVLFFAGQEGSEPSPIEVLPVQNGKLVYAPTDASERQELTLTQFQAMVKAAVSGKAK